MMNLILKIKIFKNIFWEKKTYIFFYHNYRYFLRFIIFIFLKFFLFYFCDKFLQKSLF